VAKLIGARARSDVATTRHHTHDGRFATDFFGELGKDHPGPEGFLVETPGLTPGNLTPPHFHGVNQYQLMVGGGGTIGKFKLAPGVLHYADAYTPYGPIVSGPDGLDWLTLRQGSYIGGHLMPGSKDRQKHPTGRNLQVARF
jgi:hypothetical protein